MASEYVYEHTDGSLIRKPRVVVETGGGPGEYFDSPFVRQWWRTDQLHTHMAGTRIGKHIDECAICGRDIRDRIHARALGSDNKE